MARNERATNAMGIEETKYTLVEQERPFEIRDYASYILAEVIVDAPLERAGNDAFLRLFRYISGENRSRETIAMTAPVSQQSRSAKITMTAPVSQQRVPSGFAVGFTMPSSFTINTIPVPKDPGIVLRLVPARRMAAIRYSGFWSERRYLQNKKRLDTWLEQKGLTPLGEPVWARYNPPFMPWFLRRNEILVEIRTETN